MKHLVVEQIRTFILRKFQLDLSKHLPKLLKAEGKWALDMVLVGKKCKKCEEESRAKLIFLRIFVYFIYF